MLTSGTGSLAALLLTVALLAGQPGPARPEANCVICDNYFELNSRNSKDATMAGRFCNASMYLTGYRHTKCANKDLNGCMKMTTKSWRHHIDIVGIGMRQAATLIATVVTRDCAEIPPAMGQGCHMLYGAGTTKEICYCAGDGCNAAVRLAGCPLLLSGLASCSLLLGGLLWPRLMRGI